MCRPLDLSNSASCSFRLRISGTSSIFIFLDLRVSSTSKSWSRCLLSWALAVLSSASWALVLRRCAETLRMSLARPFLTTKGQHAELTGEKAGFVDLLGEQGQNPHNLIGALVQPALPPFQDATHEGVEAFRVQGPDDLCNGSVKGFYVQNEGPWHLQIGLLVRKVF